MLGRKKYLFFATALLIAGCAASPQKPLDKTIIAIPAAWSDPAAPRENITVDATLTETLVATPAVATSNSNTLAPTVNQPAPTTSLVSWWSHFNDSLLTRLIEQALRANTTVTSAQAALQKARALRDVSAAALWPSLNASASAGPSKTGHSTTVETYSAGFDASWELDIFGVNRSALNASNAAARASAATLGNVQISIAAEVALSYIALRNVEARITIARDNLASQQETEQITQWRLQAGLVSSLEAEQARAAAAQTNALIPPLQTSIEQTQHALAVLTGQPPEALIDTLSSANATASTVPQVTDTLALSLPAETLRQRPDVRAAEYQVRAAQARVSQAEAARLPNFALSGSLGVNRTAVGVVSSGSNVISALLIAATLPVFDGGSLRAQVRVQEAALDESRIAYQAALLQALTDVEDALVALRGDRQRLIRLQQAVEAASNAALMAQQQFNSGLVDFQVVLQTQRTQLTTQDNLAGTRADISADHVRLYKALGGGWVPDSAIALANSSANSSSTSNSTIQPLTPVTTP